MQSTTRLAIRLARRRPCTSAASLTARRCFSATQPALMSTTTTVSSQTQSATRNSSPLTTQPVSEPHHSDAYAHAAPSPSSHPAQTTPRYINAMPDPPNTPYDVPSGPYRTAAPYAHTHSSETNSPTHDLPASSLSKAELDAFEPSSTSASPAHPVTTKRVPRVALEPHASADESMRASTEYAESPSSAVRNRSSPGVMRAAEEGGLGIMESEGGVDYPERELPERNPPPLKDEAEEISRAGVKNAWKLRK